MYPLALGFAAATIAILDALSWLMQARHLRRLYFPLASVGLIGLAAAAVYLVTPDVFVSMVKTFNIFLPQGGSLTITEVQPLFYGFDFSNLTQSRAWAFTTGFFYHPLSLILLALSCVKNFHYNKLFLLVWSLLMLASMLGQNRFTYYFAVNVAILSGYFCWQIYGWIGHFMGLLGYHDISMNPGN